MSLHCPIIVIVRIFPKSYTYMQRRSGVVRDTLAATLSEDQIAEHKEAFMLFDRRGDGKIDSAQLGEVLRSLGLNPTQAEVHKALKEVDPSGSNRISFDEFFPIFHSFGQRKASKSTNEGFVDGLRVFDREGNGQVSAAELRHVLTGLGEKMSEEEVDLLLSGLEDNQGQINYEEFVKTVMSG
ncbi:myosin-2 essential light chain-like [Stylophora pistillata]|uniref:myosin-2 essential light chain-like n=1 Tax=Stylophora pistillata TaxID=50429 RepID=UPI000C03C734|nr:myosin-2 essential light chain-like [Stylophora pistillata]